MKKLLISVLFLIFTATSASGQDHPGWYRAELISKAKELLNQEVLEVKPLERLSERMPLLDPTEKAECLLDPEERWESFAAGDFSWISMIGDMNRIHTLWLAFPVVNVNDPTKANTFYSKFFSYLFPDWQGASSWAMESSRESWSASEKAYKDPMISFDEMIVRQTVDGSALATISGPPDIIYYRVTSRSQCEMVSDYLLAKPRRARPDPLKRD
ncbi:MAG: hypothetical protein HKP56_16925 [Anderseniella sp.]|nr:hypothetical protein [Anderseniella sp.]